MKQRTYPLLLLSSFALLACAGPAGASSSSEPSDTATSNGTTTPIKTLDEVFPTLQSKNIAFTSLVESVEVSTVNPVDIIVTPFSERIASYEEGKYQLDVYENDALTAQLSYFKDEAGDASSASLNLLNEVVYTKLSAGGETFSWDQSVYYNLFRDLTPGNFLEEGEGVYVLDLAKPGFSSWGDYLVQSWTGISTFDTLSLQIKLSEDGVKEIVMDEVPMTDPGAEYSYARRVRTKIQSIGETKIEVTTPYPSDPENEPLRKAIAELKGASNYTTTLKAYPFSAEGFASEADYTEITRWTSTDVVSEKTHKDQSVSYSGYHGYEGGYGRYTGEDLDGMKLFTEDQFVAEEIATLFPSFHFSPDIFRFVETKEDGTSVYQLRDLALSSVLEEITTGETLGSYIGQVPIRLSVKDGHLHELSYDGAGLENFYLYTLRFDAIGTTAIEAGYFDTYEKASPVLSYEDERLCFLFEDDLQGPFDGLIMGFIEFFEIGLGMETEVPFYPTFAPGRDEYYGGITATPDGNICEIACLLEDTTGFGEYIGLLYESGFEETIDPTNNYMMMFQKGDLQIGINEPEIEGMPGGGLGFLVPAEPFLA